ncbi:MAG: siderophore-interacting protein, partial [Propionibacteriales bacterium]|nr:siderophore-interacting protein [Propionibacteriales bacterium]
MPNITITHADTGLMHTRVARSELVTPHMMRVTFAGGDLEKLDYQGFDQWFRLALAVRSDDRLDNLPAKFGVGGLLKFLTLPKGTRPVIRNYTIREFRPETAEMDVDFVIHGDSGVAGPWAASVEPGAEVAIKRQPNGGGAAGAAPA